MTKEKKPAPVYTCHEYREEMILSALQRSLNRGDLSEKERQKILKQIEELEKKMGM